MDGKLYAWKMRESQAIRWQEIGSNAARITGAFLFVRAYGAHRACVVFSLLRRLKRGIPANS